MFLYFILIEFGLVLLVLSFFREGISKDAPQPLLELYLGTFSGCIRLDGMKVGMLNLKPPKRGYLNQQL